VIASGEINDMGKICEKPSLGENPGNKSSLVIVLVPLVSLCSTCQREKV
jgi:hypothetical protein